MQDPRPTLTREHTHPASVRASTALRRASARKHRSYAAPLQLAAELVIVAGFRRHEGRVAGSVVRLCD